MQHRSFRLALTSLAAALCAVGGAAAVTGSTPDGDAHPYVGAVFVDGTVACSAVLVAPAVVATAAHCAAEGARVSVSLDSSLAGTPSLLGGTFHADAAKKSDLAVVVLDRAAPVAPARLPSPGLADTLAKGETVTSVGYGYASLGVYDGLRRTADSPLAKIGRTTLTLSTASAGPCLGDSGGPQLAGDVVLSLTSAGSKDCSGKAEGTRLDTPGARSFLGRFVPLP